MKNILVIDTSDNILKLAIQVADKSYFCYEPNTQKHVEILIPKIKSLLEQANADIKSLHEIYVCCGPGSFTGLRIGITTAITLAYALNISVYGFSCFSVYDYLIKDKQLLLPIVDGKKHQFYCTFITDKFNQSDLYDLTYEQIVEKLKEYNKSKVTIVGKDINLIKQQIQNDINGCEFKFEQGYNSKDMLSFIVNLPSSLTLSYPEPIYIRKSEAEIELMNRKK